MAWWCFWRNPDGQLSSVFGVGIERSIADDNQPRGIAGTNCLLDVFNLGSGARVDCEFGGVRATLMGQDCSGLSDGSLEHVIRRSSIERRQGW